MKYLFLILFPLSSFGQDIQTDTITQNRICYTDPVQITWHKSNDFISRISLSNTKISGDYIQYNWSIDYSKKLDDSTTHWYIIENGSGQVPFDRDVIPSDAEIDLFEYIASKFKLQLK